MHSFSKRSNKGMKEPIILSEQTELHGLELHGLTIFPKVLCIGCEDLILGGQFVVAFY